SPGEKPKPYDVTRMRYFDDLRKAAGTPVVPLATADIASGAAKLSRFDTVVLDDVAIPPDTKGRRVTRSRYVAALQSFVRGGGQLLLTDAAVPFVREFGVGGDNAMRKTKTNAGHIDFGALDNPWEKGLTDTSSQTYYEVPLGYRPTNASPHYGVTTSVWDSVKGTTVGTVSPPTSDAVGDATGTSSSAFTALGYMPYGKGQVSIFGALLPTPTEEYDHIEGLANYGVTITGGMVLNSILSYRRG
ncbi:MAG: hypothetical protein LC640_04810, partial [Frankia sp.]|nr:hypothetical protein [Frankia sp.]